MGGLGGHMAHPYENMDLTFGQLKAIFHQASKGKLQQVSEKLDGQNVFFTYRQDGLRFARNITDIRNGGMNYDDIITRWQDRIPSIASAFGEAYKALSIAIGSLSSRERSKAFGGKRIIWYSAEILFAVSRNVYNYDGDSIVIHKSGTIYDNGKPLKIDTTRNYNNLISYIPKMERAIGNTNIRIMGPVLVDLNKLSNNEPLETAIADLNSIMVKHNLSNQDTLSDFFIDHLVENQLKDLNTDYDTKRYIAELISDIDELINPRKVYLKTLEQAGLITREENKNISVLFSQAPKLYMDLIEPIRTIMREFSVELFNSVQSNLILDSDIEISRLRLEVQSVKQRINVNGSDHQRELFNKEFGRLKNIDSITSSMEGIAFNFDDRVYKFTGAFGPMNAILGIFRYGR